MNLHCVILFTANIKEMVVFYEAFFGYKPTTIDGSRYNFSNDQLQLWDCGASPPTKGLTMMYLTKNLQRKYLHLKFLGAYCTTPEDIYCGVRSFKTCDPDENIILIYEINKSVAFAEAYSNDC